MKRIGNLYSKIYSIENLIEAERIAQKGKSKQPGVIEHNRNREGNINKLQQMLENKTYKTSEYRTFSVSDHNSKKQ